jgi:hypothetical protein
VDLRGRIVVTFEKPSVRPQARVITPGREQQSGDPLLHEFCVLHPPAGREATRDVSDRGQERGHELAARGSGSALGRNDRLALLLRGQLRAAHANVRGILRRTGPIVPRVKRRTIQRDASRGERRSSLAIGRSRSVFAAPGARP